MHGIAMVFAMVVMGVIFLVSQVSDPEEFLLAFQGNEFVVGIVLGSWLLPEALGSGLTGRRADRSDDPLGAFATVQAVLALLSAPHPARDSNPSTLSGHLSVGGRELSADLGHFSCRSRAARVAQRSCLRLRLPADGDRRGGSWACAGKVYALESLGAFLGGLAFTFLLVGRAQAIEIAFCLGAVSMGGVLFLIRSARGGAIRSRQTARTAGPMECFVPLPYADGAFLSYDRFPPLR